MMPLGFIDAQFISFLVAITLLSISPGVDTLLVIRNTARGGMRDGITTSLAICCGLFVHATISALGAPAVSRWQPVKEGFLSNVLNPKTVVFYMAFLPQFIAPTDPALLKSLWLAGVHFVIANIWQISVVLMVGSASKWLASARFAQTLNAATGAVLVVFGIRLALTQRPV